LRPSFSINRRQIQIPTLLLLLGLSSASEAEYLIYLKGGHFIVAENCTFGPRQEVGKAPEADERSILTEDCTNGKPKGQIFLSTINGPFGEVNADDVYAIFGTKSLPSIKPARATMPLEDYLITNRGQSFVNSKDVPEEKGPEVYGRKRDELIKVDRRGITEIDPEGKKPGARAKGLCLGEQAEFSVTEMELFGDYFNAVVTNLSPKEWKLQFHLWVQEKAGRKWKDRRSFPVSEDYILPPHGKNPVSVPLRTYPAGESKISESSVDLQLVALLKRALDLEEPDPKLKVCARKWKLETR
jgi:hypothetical protein